MTPTKCPACDGYGRKPHRAKAGKFVRCKACLNGIVWSGGYTVAPYIVPLPYVQPTSPWTLTTGTGDITSPYWNISRNGDGFQLFYTGTGGVQ